MLDFELSQAKKLAKLTALDDFDTFISKTKILTITSGKGGVGKSTFCANFAYILANRNLKVLVLDADIGLANLQVLFDIRPKYTLFDYLNGQKNVRDIILETKYLNISLIAGKSGYQYIENTNSFAFSNLIKDILALNLYDILLIDTGAGLNDYVKEFLKLSKNILAITSTDPSALTDVYSLIKMLALNKDTLMLCFNHTKNDNIGATISNSLVNLAKKNRLKDDFMIEFLGSIPSSVKIPELARTRKILVEEFPFDETSLKFQNLVDKFLKII